MENEEFDIKGAAGFLGVPESALKYWRSTGTGPVFMKLSRRITYAKDDLIEFKESRRMKQSTRRKAA